MLVPLVAGFINSKQKIGLITGHTHLLTESHLHAARADPNRLVIWGMEHSREFQEVDVKHNLKLDPEVMQTGVLTAVEDIFRSGESIGAIVLECTNLIHFRSHIQKQFNIPVFDVATSGATGLKVSSF